MAQDDAVIRRIAKVVDLLDKRTKERGRYLRGQGGRETRTRALLIDPLLRALGWDIEDPDQVQLEFRLKNGVPDYALIKDGLPVGLVEAKGLGENLNAKDPGQIMKYAMDPQCQSVSLIAFTNGDEWVFFRESGGWTADSAKITSGQSAFTALDLVSCLDPSGLTHRKDAVVEPTNDDEAEHASDDGERWYSLTSDLPDTQPAGLRFEDGSEYELPSHNWRQAYLQVAKHLVSVGKIHRGNVPISLTRTEKYAVHSEAVHPNGDAFSDAADIGEGFWIDRPNTHSSLRYSLRLLNHCGVNPDRVMIRFD